MSRALTILEYVAARSAPVTTAEIARAVHLHRNTAYRLARALSARDYLDTEDGAFTLGPRLAIIGQAAGRFSLLLRRSEPVLQQVCDSVDEVVNLGIRRGDHVLYLGRWEAAEQRAGVYVRMGDKTPLYASGLGKVLMSAMSVEARAQYYRSCPFEAYTAHTLTRPQDLEEAVAEAARRGYAEDREELSEGVRCMAVPIIVDGRIVAAISIAYPAFRGNRARQARFLTQLRRAAARISDLCSPVHGASTARS